MINNDVNTNEIDIAKIFSILLAHKLMILVISFSVSILFFSYSKTLPDIYKSSTLLKVNDVSENSTMSSLASQYGGLASLAGISLPSSGGNKSEYVIQTLKSREFTEHLMNFKDVTLNIMAAKSYDKGSKLIKYDLGMYDFSNKKWDRDLKKYKQSDPSILEVYKEISKRLRISKDQDSGFITVSFEHISPVFARDFLNLIISQLNDVSRAKDLNESENALLFLENQLAIYKQIDLVKSINQMIKSQLQTKMMANISDDYLVKNIDKPFVPEIKSYPSRILFLILGFLIGFGISISYILIKNSRDIEATNQ